MTTTDIKWNKIYILSPSLIIAPYEPYFDLIVCTSNVNLNGKLFENEFLKGQIESMHRLHNYKQPVLASDSEEKKGKTRKNKKIKEGS